MNAIPYIIVQLVHIEGPLKGEIQELTDPEIVIGRHPDCQVQFPKDLTTLSRRHARIVREGNRFKIIDQSTNGTFVNGKPVSESFLKDGDVVTFSEGGPKLSFLTQVSDQPLPQAPEVNVPQPAQTSPSPAPPVSHPPVEPATPGPVHIPSPAPQPAPQPAPKSVQQQPSSSGPMIQAVKVPFAIQFGPALKSFQSLPITLGSGAHCDFVINHQAVGDQQAQVYFAQDQYWIKDLTGTNAITINGMPIGGQAPLQPDCQISLSPQGPKFRFLGGGRLAEVEEPVPEKPAPRPQEPPVQPQPRQMPESIGQKAGTLFKKFFS